MSWIEESEALLRRAFAEGLSAGATVASLNAAGFAVTRNAVIGKWHRLGLKRGKPVAPRAAAYRQAAPRQQHVATVAPPPPAPASANPRPSPELVAGFLAFRLRQRGAAGPVSLAAAGARQCRRPVAGAARTMLVCGAPTAPGASFCRACAGLAYMPRAKKLTAPRQRDVVAAAGDVAEQDLVDIIGEAA